MIVKDFCDIFMDTTPQPTVIFSIQH